MAITKSTGESTRRRRAGKPKQTKTAPRERAHRGASTCAARRSSLLAVRPRRGYLAAALLHCFSWAWRRVPLFNHSVRAQRLLTTARCSVSRFIGGIKVFIIASSAGLTIRKSAGSTMSTPGDVM